VESDLVSRILTGNEFMFLLISCLNIVTVEAPVTRKIGSISDYDPGATPSLNPAYQPLGVAMRQRQEWEETVPISSSTPCMSYIVYTGCGRKKTVSPISKCWRTWEVDKTPIIYQKFTKKNLWELNISVVQQFFKLNYVDDRVNIC